MNYHPFLFYKFINNLNSIYEFINRTGDCSMVCCCCCTLFVPLVIYIYLSVAASKISSCQIGIRNWLITDCIIFAFLIPEVLATGFSVLKKSDIRDLNLRKLQSLKTEIEEKKKKKNDKTKVNPEVPVVPEPDDNASSAQSQDAPQTTIAPLKGALSDSEEEKINPKNNDSAAQPLNGDNEASQNKVDSSSVLGPQNNDAENKVQEEQVQVEQVQEQEMPLQDNLQNEENQQLIEQTPEVEKQVLKMEEDFYSITFLGYIKENQVKYDITLEINHQNFTNCLFIFGLQIVLSFLVGLQMFQANFSFNLSTFTVFLTRYICAILLHLQIHPELRQALEKMKYLNNHQGEFSSVLLYTYLQTLLDNREIIDQHHTL